MLTLLSPAKTMNFDPIEKKMDYSNPEFIQQSLYLIRQAKQWTIADISSIMGISRNLADNVFLNFQNFTHNIEKSISKPAAFAYNGDAYQGLDSNSLSDETVTYMQNHLRIFSGLYGVLKPLDLIQPYRLEMGVKFNVPNAKNLYSFWEDLVTQSIRTQLITLQTNVIINLASVEYFKTVNISALGATIITPTFYNYRNGEYKMISFWAKKARGKMTRFIMQNQLTNPNDLMGFDDGYYFEKSLSKPNKPVFVSEK